MEIILTQKQLGNIFSKLTKIPNNPTLLQKFRNWIGDDQTIISIILQAIKDGNISNINYKSTPQIFMEQLEFSVGNIPIVIRKSESFGYDDGFSTSFSIEIPLINMDRTKISERIGEKIWDKLEEYNK